MYWASLNFTILILTLAILANEEKCPSKCSCKGIAQKDGSLLKMICGEREKIIDLDELELLDMASELFQLLVFNSLYYLYSNVFSFRNLSDNNLKSFAPKVELIYLQKL